MGRRFLDHLLSKTLLLDIEVAGSGEIVHVGAVFGEEVFERKRTGRKKIRISGLDRFARGAETILGHNLLGHDLPILGAAAPRLNLLKKPVIDTLYISPLAFPQNPYHRLVKDYKLVRSSLNSPVDDAKLAASVFRDQWESLADMEKRTRGLLSFYRFCFEASDFGGASGAGLARVFAALGAEGGVSMEAAGDFFTENTRGIVCAGAAKCVTQLLLLGADQPCNLIQIAAFEVLRR